MSKKALLLIVLIIAGLLFVQGCKKSSSGGAAEEAARTAGEYAAEAESEIDTENMADELDRIEAEMEQEEAELP